MSASSLDPEIATLAAASGCGEIGIHAAFRSPWGQPRGGSSPLSRTRVAVFSGPFATLSDEFPPLSSRGLGRRPLTAETGVRIPVAVPLNSALQSGIRALKGAHGV